MVTQSIILPFILHNIIIYSKYDFVGFCCCYSVILKEKKKKTKYASDILSKEVNSIPK